MSATVLKFELEMTSVECASCCMSFAVPRRFLNDRREDKATFYCPQGHYNCYRESESDRLKKQLAEKEKEVANQKYWRDFYAKRSSELRDENGQLTNRLRATKAAHTRTKNRIAKGVCPCCKRSFTDLHRHMTTKHPDYATVDEPQEAK